MMPKLKAWAIVPLPTLAVNNVCALKIPEPPLSVDNYITTKSTLAIRVAIAP